MVEWINKITQCINTLFIHITLNHLKHMMIWRAKVNITHNLSTFKVNSRRLPCITILVEGLWIIHHQIVSIVQFRYIMSQNNLTYFIHKQKIQLFGFLFDISSSYPRNIYIYIYIYTFLLWKELIFPIFKLCPT